MNVLRNARKKRGYTQERLEFETGIAQPRISKYERGVIGMSSPTAKVLAEALNVPFERLEPIVREVGRPRHG